MTEFLRLAREQVGQGLAEAVAAGCPFDGLSKAMMWPIDGGGKKLRPALLFASARAFGCSEDELWGRCLPAAVAAELVHTYSLVHDDLPAMDDDDERRGRPTVHVAFGEGLAVLSGDALLTLAFEVASGQGRPSYAPEIGDQARLAILGMLARDAGAAGMVGGQSMDLGHEGSLDEVEALERLHRAKTGALFAFGLGAGALLAGASDEEVEQMRSLGRLLGVAFQVVDDLLDAERGESGDEPSHVAVLGLEGARKRAQELVEQVLGGLQGVDRDTALLEELARMCVDRHS